eukprot:2475150-Pyramimonas_sp.AAC.1
MNTFPASVGPQLLGELLDEHFRMEEVFLQRHEEGFEFADRPLGNVLGERRGHGLEAARGRHLALAEKASPILHVLPNLVFQGLRGAH